MPQFGVSTFGLLTTAKADGKPHHAHLIPDQISFILQRKLEAPTFCLLTTAKAYMVHRITLT